MLIPHGCSTFDPRAHAEPLETYCCSRRPSPKWLTKGPGYISSGVGMLEGNPEVQSSATPPSRMSFLVINFLLIQTCHRSPQEITIPWLRNSPAPSAQDEPAEAAAIPAGATGHQAPGHTGYPGVQWVQEVFWTTNDHPEEQKRSQLQLCGRDVLCLVGKPTERSQVLGQLFSESK